MFLLASTPSFAIVCWNNKGLGVIDEVFYDLSNSFSSSNNNVGRILQLGKSFSSQVSAVCPPHDPNTSNNRTQRSYVSDLNIVETINGYKYMPINDYIIGAMQINDSYAGNFYPPVNYIKMGSEANVSKGKPFAINDSKFTLRLIIRKPFIDFIPIPKKTMFTVYVTTNSSDRLNTPVYKISYSGSIRVPQSCKIVTGDLLEIKFGDIPANAFSQAGPGNKPNNVNKQSHTLAIQCTNIDAQALLTIRLETEKSTGNMIISDNPDIGFKLSDENDNVLLPNNINSVIPFDLKQQPANVTIKSWPVSITGNKPQIGPFKARGYLRADFD